MTAGPLAARLLLDAQFEFTRTLENVPPPGRGGAIGRLSSAAWTIGHAAARLDAWVNDYCAGGERDAWCVDLDSLPPGTPVAFAEAETAFARVSERVATYLEGLDHAALAAVAPTRRGSFLEGRRVGHILYRGVAHTFAHAGELSVVSSLLRRADLGLPGPLPNSYHAPVDGDAADSEDEALRPLVRFVLDAREAFSEVAAAVPVPAQVGAFDRLNSGGWIVAHVAEQEDQYWSVHAQHREPDAWLAAAQVRFGDPASRPSYVAACAALANALERGTPYLESLRLDDLGRVVRTSRARGGEQRVQDLLVLQGTHLYALAGELAAIASLAGGRDPDLPMDMRHTIGAAS